jgi:hypothetical protein
MPSNARMTFRFDPLPAPKPVKPAQPTQPAEPTNMHPIDSLTIVPEPNASNSKQSTLTHNHTIIESPPPMNGPYQDDIRSLEEMIRRTDSAVYHIPPQSALPTPAQVERRKLSVVQELEQTEIDLEQPERWSLPEGEDVYRPTSSWLTEVTTYSRKDTPSWTRVILSVTAAIATGALFGYMVLTLFTGEPMFPGDSTPSTIQATDPSSPVVAASQASAGAADDGKTAKQSDPQNVDTSSALLEIPAAEAYVLQYGVFRNADSTQLAAAQLQDVGLPAAIDDSDGYRVYAGMAATREEAELLAAQMPNIEVYIKLVSGATLLLNADDHDKALAAFMTKSAALSVLIAHLTVSGLQDEQPQPFSQDDANALQQATIDWKADMAAIDSLSGKAKASAQTLEQSLNSALTSLTSYRDKTSRYHLWNAQTAILQSQLADRDLRKALQPAIRG